MSKYESDIVDDIINEVKSAALSATIHEYIHTPANGYMNSTLASATSSAGIVTTDTEYTTATIGVSAWATTYLEGVFQNAYRSQNLNVYTDTYNVNGSIVDLHRYDVLSDINDNGVVYVEFDDSLDDYIQVEYPKTRDNKVVLLNVDASVNCFFATSKNGTDWTYYGATTGNHNISNTETTMTMYTSAASAALAYISVSGSNRILLPSTKQMRYGRVYYTATPSGSVNTSYFNFTDTVHGDGVHNTTVNTHVVKENAITDTSTINSNSIVRFEEEDNYGILEDIMDINFKGSEFDTELFYTSDYEQDVLLTGTGTLTLSHMYTLKNTTTGGNPAVSASSTFRSYSEYDYGSGLDWTNTENASASDGNYASVNSNGSDGVNNLCLYDFDFSSIPSSATLIDIRVEIKGYASGTGNPSFCVGLIWDADNFSTTGDAICNWGVGLYCNNIYTIDINGSNSFHYIGHNYPITTGDKTAMNEHHIATWSKRATSIEDNYIYEKLTIDMIKDSDFGIGIGPYNLFNGTYYIDYVNIIVVYSTEDIIHQNIQFTGENYANDYYMEKNNNSPSYRYIFTPVKDNNYNFKVQHIRSFFSDDSDDGSMGVSSNRILTIREFKK